MLWRLYLSIKAVEIYRYIRYTVVDRTGYKKTDSALANNCMEIQHNFPNLDNTSILNKKLNIIESQEIYKHHESTNYHLHHNQIELNMFSLFTCVKPD